MNKNQALDILKAEACCTYYNNENKSCNECLWHGKKQYETVKITTESFQKTNNVVQAVKIVKMNLNDIKIKKAFTEHEPKSYKMFECRRHWELYHTQDRYLVVNKDGYLIDGYVQYLVLKEQGIEEAEVKRFTNVKVIKNSNYRNESTTYVYGIHPNSKCTKEFVWRVPNSWTWFAKNVQVGDSILCQTKFGITSVVVTSVETLDKCPVDFRVKRVAKRQIRRKGCVIEI